MVLAILQARVSSSRLPGKVLLPILGKPMLQHQLERLATAGMIDKLVVATSDWESDEPLVALCHKAGVDCFRGSLEDVLDRFYQCARRYQPDVVVRLTGDCPLADPQVIDEIVQYLVENDYDYVSNSLEPSFPDGLDVEAFRFTVLESAWREAKLPSQREHVTPFIWQQPDRFKIGSFKSETDLSHLRWTVDEPDDFELVKAIYEGLYPGNRMFTTEEILRFLRDNPDLLRLNACMDRNEGYRKSLQKDRTERES